jgi:hypothetical protein
VRIRRTTPFLLIGAIAAGACGAATVVAPRLAVSQAAENLGDLDQFAFTASIVGSDDDAVAFFSEGGEVTAEDRKNMLLFKQSNLSVAVDRGDTNTADDDKMAVNVRVGDLADAIQFRTSGKKLYLRGDVKQLADLAGADGSDISSFVDQAAQLGFGFVADAVNGKWVTTDLGPLEALAKGMAGSDAIPGVGAFDVAQIEKMMDAVGKAWRDVAVKRIGQEDAGEHFTLTASARQVYTTIKPVLGELGLPFGELPAAADVPDEKFSVDIWVDDKEIQRIEFDFTQFVPEFKDRGPVALRIDLEGRPDGISMPEDAVTVDLLEIFGRFMGGFGGSPFGGDEPTIGSGPA